MDFYDLLGVPRDADAERIKRAYRRLARRLHPDINPGDGAAAMRFRAVVEAYETLSDPDRRHRYDSGAAVTGVVGAVTFGFEGFDFTSGGTQGTDASTFGDLFADVIRESVGGSVAPEDGSDLHVSVTVSFDEMMRGTRRTCTVVRRVACSACRGHGVVAVADGPCPSCRGTGAIRSVRGRMVFSKPCVRCNGGGRQRQAPCPACGGAAAENRADQVALPIPAGVRDDERLCLPGRGHAGVRGGRSGDLYVTVAVEPHAVFRRDGDDLSLVVPVGVHEAALGARFDIPTFDGPVRLRVPPSTPAGQRFRLRGRGVPSARGGERGDLIVEIRLVLPPVLDERAKALLREFGEVQTEDVRAGLWRDMAGDARG